MSPAKIGAWIESADLVVAADSGFLRVLEAGYLPDVVVGDFDSVSTDLIGDDVEVIVDLGQDDTDCAKLLRYVKDCGHESVTLICAEGDLTDHFLDTIHSAIRTELNVTIGLERGHAHILDGPVLASYPIEVGRRTSMLPLETIENASMAGVEWPFERQTLSVRGFTSISNRATQASLSVAFDKGVAYLFIEADTPFWSEKGEP
ncbi:MAG: thiamine diphosphokinase [Armatimonadetes bacterium]|nr:thiamine diphosphokinase [Armatimonadota bacterium]MBS1727930.1 thiamine diphosphokinase [Armatimonadota bacterium]